MFHSSPPQQLLQADSQFMSTWHQVLQKSVSLQVSQKPFQCKQDEAHTERICVRVVLASKNYTFHLKKLLVSTDSQQCPPRPQVQCQLPVKVNTTRTAKPPEQHTLKAYLLRSSLPVAVPATPAVPHLAPPAASEGR